MGIFTCLHTHIDTYVRIYTVIHICTLIHLVSWVTALMYHCFLSILQIHDIQVEETELKDQHLAKSALLL